MLHFLRTNPSSLGGKVAERDIGHSFLFQVYHAIESRALSRLLQPHIPAPRLHRHVSRASPNRSRPQRITAISVMRLMGAVQLPALSSYCEPEVAGRWKYNRHIAGNR